jgi:hypothetical protein
MLCEKYKDALIEAAVTGAELAPDVRSHVETCANCVAQLTQQQSLVAAIDSNLSSQMNAPVPVAMLQRFDARLAQQPLLRRTPRFGPMFAGAFATLAAAAIIVVVLAHTKNQTHESRGTTAAAPPILDSSPVRAQAHEVESRPTVADGRRREAPSRTTSHVVSLSNAPAHTEPEVLMPDDERIALAHFIAASESRPELVAALVRPLPRSPDRPVQHIEIPDISTAGIVIEPIGEEARR